MMDKRGIIAITTGDPCGIGAEITVKALSKEEIYKISKPLVISDVRLVKQAIEISGLSFVINVIDSPENGIYKFGIIDVIDVNNYDPKIQQWGEVTVDGGKASFEYIKASIELALEGKIDAVTTGPIHKEAINIAGYKYSGHTEIFADLTVSEKVCMMLIDKHMRVSHVTTHVSMDKVSSLITKERVYDVIKLTNEAVCKMGVENPKIAVAGYNPHSGEKGLFGNEEEVSIYPAIEMAVNEGMNVEGPVPPDTVFVKMMGKQYDAVIAMYHDQGHIPMKLAGFKMDDSGKMASMSGVNVTLGLPIIRTSVDHGVAFEIAGKGIANYESMIDAIEVAALMAKNN
jgi:4-hydroxythreonine-4-phosphate dehydrogenase